MEGDVGYFFFDLTDALLSPLPDPFLECERPSWPLDFPGGRFFLLERDPFKWPRSEREEGLADAEDGVLAEEDGFALFFADGAEDLLSLARAAATCILTSCWILCSAGRSDCFSFSASFLFSFAASLASFDL